MVFARFSSLADVMTYQRDRRHWRASIRGYAASATVKTANGKFRLKETFPATNQNVVVWSEAVATAGIGRVEMAP
ncbi:hypothetical protein M2337_003431 [Sphingobium sp. B2D3A]|nr:hypothetical protein [Sphingobium sp. B2D3A]MCW2386915.1 hypothetical protein [Sphingobium sp. B2D3D]